MWDKLGGWGIQEELGDEVTLFLGKKKWKSLKPDQFSTKTNEKETPG